MNWHLAAIFETVADAIPNATAVVEASMRRSWRDYEDRAARIAAAFVEAGLGVDSKVAIYAYNSAAYLEAQFGAFKIRGVPVNVNYRYTEPELIYLFDNSDAEAVVFDAQFSQRLDAIRKSLPKLRCLIEIDDGSGNHLDAATRFEEAIAHHAPLPRQAYSSDDIYMVYTGGTTGMPKGVMFRHGEFARELMAGFVVRAATVPQSYADIAAAVRSLNAGGNAPISIPACPLMHSTGMGAGVFMAHMVGGRAVVFRNEHFDAAALCNLIQREHATNIAIVGDTFAKPMIAAMGAAKAAGHPYDLSSLKGVFSSGIIFSRESKDAFLEFADVTISDLMGATEGSMGVSIVSRATKAGETAKFKPNPSTKVFDENDQEIPPGSDKIGLMANGGLTPVGYYKDPGKSAVTFRTINGRRYSIPGDYAKIAADGTLILLGRGSSCINTGGEKVFPEEVEEALKCHPDVYDCLVIGVPDSQFGERVTAVVAPVQGRAIDKAAIIDFARSKIAGYKTPHRIIAVERVERAPNGKADYKWAKSIALDERSSNATR
jgi:3-oxocholest-4-en-26-oate---CoA ligase